MEKTFYVSKENYETLIKTWASKKEHSAADHIVYNVLRCKSADHGFVEKTKGIQCNNPWYAFNTALSDAKWMSTPRSRTDAEENRVRHFKTTFGFEAPTNLLAKLEEVARK